MGIGGQVAYNTSKAALIGLTRSCAVDLARLASEPMPSAPAPRIRPWCGRRSSAPPIPAGARRKLELVRPLNRLGKVEEIAAAISIYGKRRSRATLPDRS